MKEEWVDGDKLECIFCDSFVSSTDSNDFCPECRETQEKDKLNLNQEVNKNE